LKIKKRIVPIVLFFAILATSISVGQWAVRAAADTTAPVFESINVDKSSVEVGGTITVTVTGTDDSSGLNRAEVLYVSEIGTYTQVTLKPDGTGVLKGQLVTGSNTTAGSWMVEALELYDIANNKAEIFNSNFYYFGNNADLSAADITITGNALSDTALPTLKGITVDKTTAGPGDEVNISISASDADTGINYATVMYTSPSGASTKAVTILPDSNGSLTDSVTVGQYDEAGSWMVASVTLCDNAGNTLYVFNTEVGDTPVADDPSFVIQDLSAGDFTISGTTPDTTAPTFGSIKLDYNIIPMGGDAYLTIKGSDSQSGLSGAILLYRSPSQTDSNIVILLPDSNGDLRADIPTADLTELGQWKVDSLLLIDNAGNYIDMYNIDFYTDASLELKNLTMGNFTLVDNNSQPGGLNGVTGEGLTCKITGVNPYMEYRKSTETSYKQVTGSEITGLVPGTYYVRYAASEGFNAGADATVVIKDVFEVSNGVLVKFNGTSTDVVIPDNLGITSIGSLSFNGFSGLKSVVIPDGVTNIDGSAFSNCSSLKEITIPNSVKSIGISTFEGCTSLTSATLPNGLTSISSKLFKGCAALSSITIPESVTSIGENAFYGCSSLTSIVVPNGVTTIGELAFAECGKLASIMLPSNLTTISRYTFNDCSSLTSLDVPSSVTYIDSFAFAYCSSLKNLTLHNGLTGIGGHVFMFCSSLTSLDLPSSLRGLASNTFYCCYNLNTIRAYPMAAPRTDYNSLSSISSNTVIYTLPGATGYNSAPWTNYTQSTLVPGSIEISVLPKKTAYIVGQRLNLTGMVVSGIYEGGMKIPLAITEANVSGFDSSTPAEGQTITVTFGGKTATFNVDIIAQPTETYPSGNLASGKLFTSSVFKNLALITDGNKAGGTYSEDSPSSGIQYVQLDLGKAYDINEFKLWHYFGDARKYKDVIVQISNDPKFATGVTTVFNNDTDNSSKLGTGTDLSYAETSAGLDIEFNQVNGRYLRFYSNGSSVNAYNHYVEIEIYGLLPVIHPESVSMSKTAAQMETGTTYSLTATVSPSDTTNKNVTWSSSDDSIATVSAAGIVTGIKPGTANITATTVDGSHTDSCEMTVTLAPSKLSTGKAITNSSAFTNAAWANDGYKGTDKYANSVGSGLQYLQVDLGAYYDLTKINLWHYFGDARTYKDVVVQVSNDPAFATDVTTVFNNDTNNSAGLGFGTDAEYAETSAGKIIPFDKVNARYVRLYSNGSYVNGWNHYVEVEVYGFDGPVVSATSVSLNKTSDTIMAGGSAALAAKFMPLNTTNQNVTWSSSNESVATVNANGVYTAVAPGTATITATAADGGFTADCEVTVTEAVGNLAKGKTMTSSTGFTNLALANDGSTSTDFYANGTAAGLQWVQVDLGASFEVNHFNLWHYYGGSRTYKDVIVQLSDDPEFKTYTTVYNNDTNNSAGKGTGTDSEYVETSAGLSVDFAATKARYARFYSNGSSINGYNHYVEIEISKEIPKINYSQGKTVTTSGAFGNVAYATDKSVNTDQYANGAGTGLQWLQVDLGAEQDINQVNLWHYFGSARTYKDVIVQISNDPEFKTYTSVYNNDANNSAGFGAGKDAEYAETAAGKCITFSTVKGRYVRFYSNGSSINGYNHYVEVEVCNNLAAGKMITGSGVFQDKDVINDGYKDTNAYSNGASGLQWIQVNLGAAQDINEINLWHYAGRTYKDVIVQVSNDPEFKTYTTVFNNDANNSAGFGAGTAAEYLETSAGKKITFNTVNAQYVRFYSNGSNVNGYNHYVEVEICNNLAAGKIATASSAFTNTNYIADGDKNVDKYANGLAPGLQWVQIDLGDTKSVSEIDLWHYFGGSRQYHDVIVQLSDDPTFKTYTTVYSNDTNNSAGFGIGKDTEYVETSLGKKIKFDAVSARYVRFYSNGSNINGYNHYVEAEVLGN